MSSRRQPSPPAYSRMEALHALERMVVRMAEQMKIRDRLAEEQAMALERSRSTFERAAVAAKIGVWECDLTDETLAWTDGVYDLFELPHGFRVTREEILGFYSPRSREELERIRTRTIRECGSFTLDAEIVTALGNKRWMRITANVDRENGVPVRLFGIKQDITEDRLRLAALGS